MTEITNILDGMPLDIEAERRILEILRPFIGRSNTPELREQMCDALLRMGKSHPVRANSRQPCGYIFGGCTFIPAGSPLLTEVVLSNSTAVYWTTEAAPVETAGSISLISLDAIKEALEFYADLDRWSAFRDDAEAAVYDANMGSDLGDDSGDKARAALRCVAAHSQNAPAPSQHVTPDRAATIEDYRAVLKQAKDYIRFIGADENNVAVRHIDQVLAMPEPPASTTEGSDR